MDKKFWGILSALVVVAIILAIIFSGGGSTTNAKPTEHIEGSAQSGIKLVEYGDFECPICANYFPVVKQVTEAYGGLIQFQFRNFPLTQIHQNALAGARAAEAAGQQGKYWGMHDLLYENNHYDQQTGWVVSGNPLNDYFLGYAKQLKLDIAKFKADYSSSKINDRIQADKNAGDKLNVQGTPAFFLNGEQIPNEQLSLQEKGGFIPSFEKFSEVLNAALKKKGINPPKTAQSNTTNATPEPAQTKKNQ